MSSLIEKSVVDIIKNYYSFFSSKSNVIGIGFGNKSIKNMDTKEPCLHVLVEKKIPLNKLYKHDIISSNFLGIKTDIIQCGSFDFLNSNTNKSKNENINKLNFCSRKRPIQAGYSVGVYGDPFTGTLGAIVFGNKKNTPYILSNNHVLADDNKYEKGTYILQPAAGFGGNYYHNVIATLTLAIKQYFDGVTINYTDAAIAEIFYKMEYDTSIPYIGKIKGVAKAYPTMAIRKTGATTGYTTGHVGTTFLKLNTTTEDGGTYLMENQIFANRMSEAGDSGSVVVDNNNNAVGLLMGANKYGSIINPIDKTLNLLDVHF
ncbi:hypothetical protein [Clostridium tarantellae]|uniref:Serine protease n=1 Tax=Clostridium tarantellae TaxID=39493 RepID=A0A6I1MNG8_9CLOT|nr:hypothetical protein [Clostridium tarantellae]MPQ44955.1 hypothetical protein [Clostridium tarantellae]